MVYYDLVLSGKTTSKTIFSGDSAYNTLVRNGAKLRISAGGYVESTTAMNSTIVSNAGSAVSTFLSGGTMTLLKGAVADTILVLRNARLTVSVGAVATGVYVSGGNVFATVKGGDETTLVTGVNEKGSFFISGGTAANFLLGAGGQLMVSSGGTALDTVVNNNGSLTVSCGGVASGIVHNAGGKITTTVRGGDTSTLIAGSNESGSFGLSNGVASGFILYENATQNVSNGGVAVSTHIISSWAHQFVNSGGLASETSVFGKGSMTVYGGGIARDLRVYSGGSAMICDGTVSGATVMGDMFINSAQGGADESSGLAKVGGVNVISGGRLIFTKSANIVGTVKVTEGTLQIVSGVKISKVTVHSGGSALVSGGFVVTDSAWNVTVVNTGSAEVFSGAVLMSATASSGGKLIASGPETRISGATVAGGTLLVSNGGIAEDVSVGSGTLTVAGAAAVANRVAMTEGTIEVKAGAAITGIAAAGGRINVGSGGVVNAATGDVLANLNTVAGARIDLGSAEQTGTIAGENTDIAANTLYYDGNALGVSVAGGAMKNLGADGRAYRIAVGTGITVEGGLVQDAWGISAFGDAVVSGAVVSGGTVGAGDKAILSGIVLIGGGNSGIAELRGSAAAFDTVVSGGGVLLLNAATAAATGTVVYSGGTLRLADGGAGTMENTTLRAGAALELCSGAVTGEVLTLDFSGTTGDQSLAINDLGLVNEMTKIVLVCEAEAATYTIATTGSVDKSVNCGEWGLYSDPIKAGELVIDAFAGMTYSFNAAGTAITVDTVTMTELSSAGSIENGTLLADGGRAAKWTANTGAAGTIKAATSAIAGDAWLEIDGTNLDGTTLYGADVGFDKAVNLYATGGATIGNLAAGAATGGTVESVKLTIGSATAGAAYAGGFGNVTSSVETLIGSGAKMTRDFYAGALANYNKTHTATSTGDIALTIDAGEFSGNIYGAAAVKAGAATNLVHSVGNVAVNIRGGETKKGEEACLFAGGYATGSTASDDAVYTAGSVSATIEGGTWTSTGDNTAKSGRGVFGGVFASQVTASTEDVTLTITGGFFGNVYGGGWAQKNGRSITGDVTVSVAGGTVTNVYGCGTHSISGGSTEVGNVTILVTGGAITGDIFVHGQLEGDVATGDEFGVIFSGDTDFGCGVWGYSYTGGDTTLNYSGYTGTFSGKLGGFTGGIKFDGDTAMTLATAAEDVSNTAWEFDFTDRAAALAGTSFLTWDNADFAGDTVKVAFADEDQAKAGWNIASADFAGAFFTLKIDGMDVANVAYDTAIADGDWAGWKFTCKNNILKFQLA